MKLAMIVGCIIVAGAAIGLTLPLSFQWAGKQPRPNQIPIVLTVLAIAIPSAALSAWIGFALGLHK